MKLINYKEGKIIVTDEALLVKSIRTLYEKDKSKNKETFYDYCSIIYFMADPRSTYVNDTIDVEERFNNICLMEGIKVKMSKDLQRAIDDYSRHIETSSSKILKSSQTAVNKVRDFLEKVDLFEEDDKGKPKYTINSITTALSQCGKLAKELKYMEEMVTKELEEQGRTRGGSDSLSIFEDGFGA